LSEFLKTSLRLPSDLMDRLKWECLRRKTNQTAAVIAGLELWLDDGATAERPSTAIPEKQQEVLRPGDGAEINLSVVWSRAQAADPLLAAKLIEALQLVGNSSARPDSMANRPSTVDALAAAKAATQALERETRAAEELAAPTETSHGGSTEAAPGPRRLKGK